MKYRVRVEDGTRFWWKGDPRIEPLMIPIAEALDRCGVYGDSRIDIYNRCYEAINKAIQNYQGVELK